MAGEVNLVTLSDSVSSPPRCRAKQALNLSSARNVVCLVSDTESDGSFNQFGCKESLSRVPTCPQELCQTTVFKNNDNTEKGYELDAEVVDLAREDDSHVRGESTSRWSSLQSCSIKKDCLTSPLSTSQISEEKEWSSDSKGHSIDSPWSWGDRSLFSFDIGNSSCPPLCFSPLGRKEPYDPPNYIDCLSDDETRQGQDKKYSQHEKEGFARPVADISDGDYTNVEHIAESYGCKEWKIHVTERRDLDKDETDSSRLSGKDMDGSERVTVRETEKQKELGAQEAEKKRKQAERIRRREEDADKKRRKQEERARSKQQKQEEKQLQLVERRKKIDEEKRRKEQLRAEAAERRKLTREREKCHSVKNALQNIRVLIDTKVVEGMIGGHLLGRLSEKGYKYHLVSNPIEKTVVWQMKMPCKDVQTDFRPRDSQDSQLSLEVVDLSYVLVVLEAEDFTEMIVQGSLDKHILNVQRHYPTFTVCYLINKLMWYLNKKDQHQYRNQDSCWVRPPVEKVLARLITQFNGVHSRLCLDEAEVADHVVGLTRSLARCSFNYKLTTLSVNANGRHIKNDLNRDVIQNNLWLKALVAIPKVSGACAIAIAKKYPTMQSLFKAYLDTSCTISQKELLLQDLVKERLLGGEGGRCVGPACSRRVYRILMAQNGNLKTDNVDESDALFMD
eukprot:c26729_g1_i1 orf=106-2133(+)